MTPPNNTVAGLAEKWRADADFYRRAGEGDKSVAYDRCADELEAALASPAPSAGVGVSEDTKRWEWLSDEHAKEHSRLAVYFMDEDGPASPVDYDGLEATVDQFIAEDSALQRPATPSVEDQP